MMDKKLRQRRATSELEYEPRRSSHPAPAGTHLQIEPEQGQLGAGFTARRRLSSERAELERVPAAGKCYRISDRNPVANQSFHVLVPIPAPDLGTELGTVLPSPPGTNQWAVLVGAAGIKRLFSNGGSFDLQVGEKAVVAVDVEFEGTTLKDIRVVLPNDALRCG